MCRGSLDTSLSRRVARRSLPDWRGQQGIKVFDIRRFERVGRLFLGDATRHAGHIFAERSIDRAGWHIDIDRIGHLHHHIGAQLPYRHNVAIGVGHFFRAQVFVVPNHIGRCRRSRAYHELAIVVEAPVQALVAAVPNREQLIELLAVGRVLFDPFGVAGQPSFNGSGSGGKPIIGAVVGHNQSSDLRRDRHGRRARIAGHQPVERFTPTLEGQLHTATRRAPRTAAFAWVPALGECRVVNLGLCAVGRARCQRPGELFQPLFHAIQGNAFRVAVGRGYARFAVRRRVAHEHAVRHIGQGIGKGQPTKRDLDFEQKSFPNLFGGGVVHLARPHQMIVASPR